MTFQLTEVNFKELQQRYCLQKETPNVIFKQSTWDQKLPFTESCLFSGLSDVPVKDNVNNPELQKHDLNKFQKIDETNKEGKWMYHE